MSGRNFTFHAEYTDKYNDIIGLPHWKPRNHVRMPLSNRAAQFAPFAALSGYEDEIAETGRQTDREIVLDEYEAGIIDAKLRGLRSGDVVSVKYFRKDERKDGGSYPVVNGMVRKIDLIERTVEIVTGIGDGEKNSPAEKIPIESIVGIEYG